MKTIKILTIFCLVLMISGCSNFSPRSQQRINNPNGKIEEIKSNQNGIIAEIGKLKQNTDILGSQLKEVQNGLINISSKLSDNENSGVQILQGDGALILVFAIATIAMILWHRNKIAEKEKTISILAKEVTNINDAEINDRILREATKKGIAKQVLSTLQSNLE
jgi:hypothetical protein